MKSRLFQLVLVTICVALLSACGLRLKGTGSSPTTSKHIFVSGIPAYNPFVRQLQKTVALSGGSVTDNLKTFDVHLHVFDQHRIRREISLSQRGKANEYELIYEIIFEVIDKDGNQVMPKQNISITRDYFNPQVQVLGKANEENTIWQEIYKTSVNNLLQRLEVALKQPGVEADPMLETN